MVLDRNSRDLRMSPKVHKIWVLIHTINLYHPRKFSGARDIEIS
jgi:hypothetical protein